MNPTLFFLFSAEFYDCKCKNFRTHNQLIDNYELIRSMHMVVNRRICASTSYTIVNVMNIGASADCKWLTNFTGHIGVGLKQCLNKFGILRNVVRWI